MPHSRSKSDRLKLVSRFAQVKELRQLKLMHDRQAQLDQHRNSLSQLQSYQTDYFDDSIVPLGSQQSAQSLSNRMRFLTDLSQALAVQNQSLDEADLAWQQEHLIWQTLNARSQRMQSLVEDTVASEQLEADTKQDRENDDLWNIRNQADGVNII